MTIVTRHYASLHAALDAIEGSKVPDSTIPDVKTWRMYTREGIGQDQSIKSKWEGEVEPLDTFLEYARNFSAPYLGERAKAIQELSAQLQANGLHAVSMKRHAVWTRQGSRINPHRVLRGQLSTAWRKTVREQRSSTMGRIALVLNLAVSANIPTEQILWSTAATLALAEIARQAGRSVDLYGVAYGTAVFPRNNAHVLCMPLMRSHEVWSIHNTALTTSAAFFRRLCFRLWEIEQPTHGAINMGYGYPGSTTQIRPWCDTVLAPHIGLPAQSIYIGVTQADSIANMASARAWLTKHIDALDAA